ncbi:MAG: hypothetical protein V7K72_06355 [Nostoc sp.]|uniref:hypothetical protein n=1 Tax=Nostoc sp. TaxID=1180 RepID=UPI002FFC2469
MNLGFTQQIFHEHPDYLAQKLPQILLNQGFKHCQTVESVGCEVDAYKPWFKLSEYPNY